MRGALEVSVAHNHGEVGSNPAPATTFSGRAGQHTSPSTQNPTGNLLSAGRPEEIQMMP